MLDENDDQELFRVGPIAISPFVMLVVAFWPYFQLASA
jgi:hypothetical protein